MVIKSVACIDGTNYRVGENLNKGTVKEIYLTTFEFNVNMCEVVVRVTGSERNIHIPYHAVLLYVEE